MLCWIFLGLGIVTTCVFLYKRDSNGSRMALLLKTAASLMFITTAVVAIYYNRGDMRYGLMIVMGLVLGMLGDIWLDLKWIYPNDIKYFLYGGFIFFLLGHLCFTSAVVLINEMPIKEFLLCLIPPVLIAIGVQLCAKPLKLDFTGYKFISSLYGAFLAMTVSVSARSAIVSGGATSQVVMTVGAALFFLSDFMLSGTYFGQGKNSKPYVVLNHILYYSGQFMIAMSVFFCGK